MSLSRLPRVTIVVTTYFTKSYPYLKLCMESIKNLNYPASELDVVLCCHQFDYRQYKREFGAFGVNVITPPEVEYNNARGLNFGIANADSGSKYYFILNDDVILTKESLINLVNSVGDHEVLASPIAPCDQGRQFNLIMGITANENFVPLNKNYYRLEDVQNMTNHIMNSPSIYPAGFIYTDFHCLFAGFIPKSVWDKVGKFEEGFRKCGPDDLDYSLRCQQKGIRCAFVLNSFVFHFGGASSENNLRNKDRAFNARVFKRKWNVHQPGITDAMIEQWEKE